MKRSKHVLIGLTLAFFLLTSAFLKGCFCTCFVAGTLIATPSGPVAIEKLQPGDMVWSFDHKTDKIVAHKVLRVWRHAFRPYRSFQFPDGRRIQMTGSHPVYDAQARRYMPVSELTANATLLTLRPSFSTKARVSALPAQQPQATKGAKLSWFRGVATVYTLTVEGTHNYFAGGMLVHNKSPSVRSCARDEDCKEFDIIICNRNGECKSDCDKNAECRAGTICESSQCKQPQCKLDGECGDKERCLANKCVPQTCQKASDCKHPSMLCEQGKCAAICKEDRDCTTSSLASCLQSRCIAK